MLLARMVRAFRESERMTVKTLAKRIGVEYTCLWRFENGKQVEARQWVKIVKWALTE